MAEPVYVFIEGANSGKFESDITKAHKVVAGGIAVLSFANEVLAPKDVATGQASGRRQFKPLHFTKQADSTSPLFWSAITKNEVLKKVEFKFFRITKSGQMENYFSIVLDNASKASMKKIQATESEGGESAKTTAGAGLYAAREEISVTFEKITWEHVIAKKMAADSWAERV